MPPSLYSRATPCPTLICVHPCSSVANLFAFERNPIPRTKTLSPAQLEANRTNARLSSGARTAAGKARSCRNAFKHGLTGKNVLIPEGEESRYEHFISDLVEGFHPVGALELQLAREIANCHWRLDHVRSVEQGMFASAEPLPSDHGEPVIAQGRLFLHHSKDFTNVTLYEQRIHRNIKNSSEELRRLQAERTAALGFVFSTAEIRDQKVAWAKKCGFNLAEYEERYAKLASDRPLLLQQEIPHQ